eukprot:jgi/Botrbrau1/22729/Bobra.0132s0067.1
MCLVSRSVHGCGVGRVSMSEVGRLMQRRGLSVLRLNSRVLQSP